VSERPRTDERDTADDPSHDHDAPHHHDADEDEVEVADEGVREAFEGAVVEGDARLNRSLLAVLATGAVGGVDLGIGVLAMLTVRHATGSELLGGLAFAVGFIALVLGRSELFTENFLVPILSVVAGRGRWRDVGRLWAGTMVANLVGGWVIMAIVVAGVPQLRTSDTLVEVGNHFAAQGITLTTFASAVLGGASITLLTWMERSTDAVIGKIVAAVSIAFVLTATPLLHSIVTSLEMFGTLWVDPALGYGDWAGIFGWAVLGNVVGGVLLVTVLRLAQATGAAQQGPHEGEADAARLLDR
jgi:formate/nitrite transporter FocA (FNT family)